MSHDSSPKSKICPYWAPNTDHLCMMTKGGLYVPLHDHILTFCRTANFPQCPQYIRGCEALLDLARKRGLVQEQGRRRHQRFSGRYSLRVAMGNDNEPRWEQAPAGGHGAGEGCSAWTVDLSLGGMRIETSKAVPADRVVSFTFGEDFSMPEFAGLAEVRWCRPVNGDGRYHCGLGFLDYKTSKIIGETLGLHAM